MSKPLAGIRILEFGNFIAGPFCGMLLADMGADVIKIEAPKGGDMARATPPFVQGESASFIALNRNKRSIALDLKAPQAPEIVRRMAAQCDAVIENFRPGVMDGLGIGPDVLRAANPKLVYTAVSGFGQTGPLSQRAAVNLIIEAASGTLSVTGEEGEMPVRPGIQTGDMLGALFATYAVLSGLLGAGRFGEGRYADVSLIEASLAASAFETADYFASGEIPRPLGNKHRLTAPYQLFQTRDDRFIAVGSPNDQLFVRLCQVLDLPQLLEDERYRRYADRKRHEATLVPVVEAAIRERDSEELEASLVRSGLPCSIVRNYEEALRGEQGRQRRIVTEAIHPVAGRYETVRNPVLFDRESPTIERSAPLLGEHSVEVMQELGLEDALIEKLRESGALLQPEKRGMQHA
ncbi:MAG: CaiB/BaiF CoA transferase family protein [Noviherbaspirillum sp.]